MSLMRVRIVWAITSITRCKETKMKKIMYLINCLNRDKAVNARKERHALKEQIKQQQKLLREEKKKFKQLQKEVDKMAKLMSETDEEEEEEEEESEEEEDEETESEEESESEESEEEESDSDDEKAHFEQRKNIFQVSSYKALIYRSNFDPVLLLEYVVVVFDLFSAAWNKVAIF